MPIRCLASYLFQCRLCKPWSRPGEWPVGYVQSKGSLVSLQNMSSRRHGLLTPGEMERLMAAGEIDTVELEGTAVRALSPAARLVDLCVTSAALRPGNTLAVYMQATELIDRHHARIDWEWVQSAFERLDLVPHAGVMLAQLPERVRAPVPILQ